MGTPATDAMDEHQPGLDMVHLLRAITVGLDLIGARFARANQLHATDLRALIHLLDASRSGRVATPGWLGEQLGLNSASTTALVDRLQRLGHVRRVRDTTDRRRVMLVVEPQAVALGWSFFGPLITDMVGAMSSFTPTELATVRRFLERINEVVNGGEPATTARTSMEQTARGPAAPPDAA